MFQVEEIFGVKINRVTVKPVEKMPNIILLVPDALNDIIEKINMLGFENVFKDVEFINGYALLNYYKYITKNGKIITSEDKIVQDFSCDCALVWSSGAYCFIDGKTGRKISNCYMAAGSFNDGYAPVQEKEDTWRYINMQGKFVTNHTYQKASCFFNGYALVNDYNGWHFINTKFQNVASAQRYSKEELEILFKFFNNNPALYVKDEIERRQYGNKTVFIDSNTGFSIRVFEVLARLYEALKIPRKEGSIKVQLAYIVDQASQRGTLAMDLTTFKLLDYEIVKGLKISGDGKGTAISFDEKDLNVYQSLGRKKENNG